MGAISSLITRFMIVYLTVYSDADQRKHQSSASLAFVWGIHRGPVNSPHKWPVTRKMFPFDDVIMSDAERVTRVMSSQWLKSSNQTENTEILGTLYGEENCGLFEYPIRRFILRSRGDWVLKCSYPWRLQFPSDQKTPGHQYPQYWVLCHSNFMYLFLKIRLSKILTQSFRYQSFTLDYRYSPSTFLPRDKMAAISQTTIWNEFSWEKSFIFWFHWSLCPGVQLTICQHWFR